MMLMTGQCFGEWGLIYKQERSSSAFCVEETDLFLLDLNSFELSFSVKLLFLLLEMYDKI